MDPLAYVVMAFGAVLALVGIGLFAKKGTEGKNTVKMFGVEFQLAGSALVIFVVGSLIFLVPILYEDKFRESGRPDSSYGIDLAPSKSPPVRDEIRSLVANYLKVSPQTIDMSTPLKHQPIEYDDFDTLEIVLAIEEQYNVEIPDFDLERVSIDSLARAVEADQQDSGSK